ncbi:hypothetical protein SAMN05421810_102204 [Amycolatopsis arida]|uniref:Uncharacterized protein n=1 Tax=Amycolatopsis arida TaxID=587909 RepID=A0A1I5PA76_9PSEU|nr:hypothetical protein [Amycolatopsis arida]TDX98412.1 hypothetical protein CLV69_101204 [Amycolatopsis arida]SFP30700.1 hypothetical protein SAMN05421810_102204 [Amycolatopsis arida]
MRSATQLVGFVLLVMGVSGTIDRLAYQPIMGSVLNVLNRQVFPRVDVLQGYEVFANLSVAVLGVVLLVAAERSSSA